MTATTFVQVVPASQSEKSREAAADAAAGRARNDALDFTKGVLVLVMVLYHWLNYFVETPWDVYRYLRFLTPSFIFITGFLVSHVYFPRFAGGSRRMAGRLATRGIKLLLLFSLLNVAASLVIQRNHDGAPLGIPATGEGLLAVYVIGDGRAMFEVLVSIAYVLLLAPLALTAMQRSRVAVTVFAVALLISAAIAEAAGIRAPNLQLVSIGVLGVVIGNVPLKRIDPLMRHPGWLAVVYATYLAAITRWNVLFPLQVVGVCATLLLIYLLGVTASRKNAVTAEILELGRYSLFAYIAQVLVLQVLRRALRGMPFDTVGAVVPLVLGVALTVAAVRLVDRVRRSVPVVDRAYRLVFA